jgi:signal transduction histidine kinase
VLIHVLGVGAIVWVMVQREQDRSRAAHVDVLGRTLAGFAVGLPLDLDEALPVLERGFKSIAVEGSFRTLRAVRQDGHIAYSTQDHEIGTRHIRSAALARAWPTGPQLDWTHHGVEGLEQINLTCPINAAEPWMVEGVLASLPPNTSRMSGWAIVVGLVSTLALLLMCQRLHSHFRPLATIGARLVRHQDKLANELTSLRLAATQDAVAGAWNHMIGLFEDMQRVAGQRNVYEELSQTVAAGMGDGFLQVTDVIPEGMLHVVNGTQVRYMNSAARRFLALPDDLEQKAERGEEIALDDIAATPNGEKIVAGIHSGRRGDRFESRSDRIRLDDGEVLRLRLLPAMGQQRGDAVIMISDVTAMARAELAREALFAQVTHELRTPLTNIRAYTETLADVDDPETAKECYNVIDKETRRLSRLVEEMLSQTQMGLGTIQIRYNDVDIKLLLEEAVRDLRATAEAKNLALTAELPSKMPKLQADRDKLAVVVNNIIGNALKYTADGGTVTVTARTERERVLVSVKDSGIGIAPEHHDKVFEEMFRVDSEAVQQQIGTGIGLFTAREIVRRHGGEVSVHSTLGEGTEFVVDLPVEAKALPSARTA